MSRKDLKLMSKKQAFDNLGSLFLVTLIIYILQYMLSSSLILYIIAGPFALSYAIIYLGVANGNKDVQAGDAFSGFQMFGKAVALYLWETLFLFLWFFVPGAIFVKNYSYSMAKFIALENPDLTALECVTRSKQMMKGHKWELCVLDLSFIGWALLSVITCGIASIWYAPYLNTAHANFYKKLKGEI